MGATSGAEVSSLKKQASKEGSPWPDQPNGVFGSKAPQEATDSEAGADQRVA